MYTVTVSARVDHGTLQFDTPVQVPADVPDGDHEIVITITQRGVAPPLLWPEGFFDQTYGVFASEPLERPDQGIVDVREPLE